VRGSGLIWNAGGASGTNTPDQTYGVAARNLLLAGGS